MAGRVVSGRVHRRGYVVTGQTVVTAIGADGDDRWVTLGSGGDARAGSTKQLVSAAGEGPTTALMIRHYLEQTKVVRPRREEVEA